MFALVLAAAVAAATPGTATADARNSLREVCAKQRAMQPDAAKARAEFKACLGLIRLDGDLPPRKAAKP